MDEAEARLWWAVTLFSLSVPAGIFGGMGWATACCFTALILAFLSTSSRDVPAHVGM